MRYLLDTNICIHISNRRPPAVEKHFSKLAVGQAGMSIMTWLELKFGASKSRAVEDSLAKLDKLANLIPVVPLQRDVGDMYGRLRCLLERKGTPIGAYDLIIAAHALHLGLTLVTNDTSEFARIPGLRVENWAADGQM